MQRVASDAAREAMQRVAATIFFCGTGPLGRSPKPWARLGWLRRAAYGSDEVVLVHLKLKRDCMPLLV